MDEDGSANTTGITAREGLDAISDRLDTNYSKFMSLVYVYVAMVMVTGLVGNLLVVVVYVTKFKATTTRCFIVALAVSDLLSSTVVMPFDFVELFTSSSAVCKALRCTTALTYTFSGYLTLVVAIDRYRRICYPFASQLTVNGAKRAVMGCFVAAMAFSWPHVFISGEEREGLNGTRTKCGSVKYPDGIPYHVIFYSTMSLQCLGGGVAMVTLYSIIGWKMLKRRRLYGNSQPRQSGATAASSSTNDTLDETAVDFRESPQLQASKTCPVAPSASPIHTNAHSCVSPQSGPRQDGNRSERLLFGPNGFSSGKHNTSSRLQLGENYQDVEAFLPENRKPAFSASLGHKTNTPFNDNSDGQQDSRITSFGMEDSADKDDSADLQEGTVERTGQGRLQSREAAFRHMTFTLFLVTLVYILSFLPFFVMRVLAARKGFDGLGGAPLAVIEMLYRSLYFQSATNPAIYGVRHNEFRAKCRQLLKKRK